MVVSLLRTVLYLLQGLASIMLMVVDLKFGVGLLFGMIISFIVDIILDEEEAGK